MNVEISWRENLRLKNTMKAWSASALTPQMAGDEVLGWRGAQLRCRGDSVASHAQWGEGGMDAYALFFPVHNT
jgi:hypothetical protein